jgi:hypothetical protein
MATYTDIKEETEKIIMAAKDQPVQSTLRTNFERRN